jgi:hypothetical protein
MPKDSAVTSLSISFSNRVKFSEIELINSINELSQMVSSGGYVFVLTEFEKSFKPGLSIEAIVLRELMNSPDKRDDSWLFFGNGAIRGYSEVSKKLSSTWQWLILQKSGEKTLSRRKSSSSTLLKKVALPVSHFAFTRDVANNVWHLPEKTIVQNAINRFGALLTWPGDIMLHSQNGKSPNNVEVKRLDLSNDLIGVAQKKIYLWDNKDTLF